MSAPEHDEHSSFIKTPQQLIVTIVLAFLVPVLGIVMVIQLVLSKPSADPSALEPQKVAERLQPVGRVEFGAAQAAAGSRSGEEIVKAVCSACHQAGVAGAPKIGDAAEWGKRVKEAKGLPGLLAVATKGKGAMPPKGGAADLTDEELARAIATMANQSGQHLQAPAAKPAPAAKK